MSKLLLDTHALIWLAEKDARLGKKALAHITKAHAADALFVSAISFWEVGMLVAKKRILLSRPLDFWRADVIAGGIAEIPVSGDIALLATQLDWSHADPADRLVVASSMLSGAGLITADKVILRYRTTLKRWDARK